MQLYFAHINALSTTMLIMDQALFGALAMKPNNEIALQEFVTLKVISHDMKERTLQVLEHHNGPIIQPMGWFLLAPISKMDIPLL